MKFSDYMKDNQITLLVCFAGGLFFSVLLLAFGISLSEMALLWVCFAIIVFFTMFAYFRKQQKRIQYLLETMETLDEKIFNCGDCRQTRNRIRKKFIFGY